MKIEHSNHVSPVIKTEQQITDELQKKGLIPFQAILSTTVDVPYKNEVRDVHSSKVAKVIDTTSTKSYKKK